MRLIIISLAVSASLLLTTCSSQTKSGNNQVIIPYIKLASVADQPLTGVESHLGKGQKLPQWKDPKSGCSACPKYSYRKDSIEVIYINGKADRITLNHLSNFPFDEAIIERLGLPAKKPDFGNENVLRWKDYAGYREIAAFSTANQTIDYVLVMSKSE